MLLVFAKEFFHVIDLDGDASIKVDELLTALISLGVTTNAQFLHKVCKTVAGKKF